MAEVAKTLHYLVSDEPDENGHVTVTVITAKSPAGYSVNVPNDLFQIQATALAVLAAQGDPPEGTDVAAVLANLPAEPQPEAAA